MDSSDIPQKAPAGRGLDEPPEAIAGRGPDAPHDPLVTPGPDAPHDSLAAPGPDAPHDPLVTPGPDAPHDARPAPGPDVHDWVVGIAFVATIGILIVEQLNSDRLPVSLWALPASFVLTGLVAGVAVGAARIKLGTLCLALVAYPLVAGAAGDPSESLVAVLVLVFVVGVAVGVGSTCRRLLIRVTDRRRLSWPAAAAAFLLALTPYPIAVLQRQRTIHVGHPAGRVVDERAGSFRGVGLGDSTARVSRALGQPPSFANASQTDSFGPLVGGALFDGPSSTDVGSRPEDSFMRYAHAAFQIRAGRVRSIQIDDRTVATAAGIGPGDTIRLVRKAYPGAICGEDSIHEEPDDLPYPVCEVAAGRHRWLTFFGTYGKPGEPVLAVWLSTDRLEPPH